MNLTTELDDKVYRRYVQSLPIGSSTRLSYYAALRRFRWFMATQTSEDPLSQETIIAWLEHLSSEL